MRSAARGKPRIFTTVGPRTLAIVFGEAGLVKIQKIFAARDSSSRDLTPPGGNRIRYQRPRDDGLGAAANFDFYLSAVHEDGAFTHRDDLYV